MLLGITPIPLSENAELNSVSLDGVVTPHRPDPIGSLHLPLETTSVPQPGDNSNDLRRSERLQQGSGDDTKTYRPTTSSSSKRKRKRSAKSRFQGPQASVNPPQMRGNSPGSSMDNPICLDIYRKIVVWRYSFLKQSASLICLLSFFYLSLV